MSKIVCDVCGSSYSESESHCPICGTAKADNAKPDVKTSAEESSAKAGKYSKTNAKKTGNGRQAGQEKTSGSRKQEAPSNVAMIAIVAVLLLAIVVVCVFIAVRMIDKPDTPDNTTVSTTTEPTEAKISCEKIELADEANKTLTFNDKNTTVTLTVNKQPENTTDVVSYSSSDNSVVYVDSDGVVKPMGPGEATITIKCGKQTIEVSVTSTVTATLDPSASDIELELTTEDFTLSPNNGTSYDLFTLIKDREKLDKSQLVYTSEDESVVRIEGSKAIAVSNNSKGVLVTITYGNASVTCRVRVNGLQETAYQLTSGYTTGSPTIDITATVGETITLKLVNKETGVPVTGLTWTASKDFDKCCTKTEKDGVLTVKAEHETASVGHVYIEVTYEGVAYRCKITVKAATTQE